MSCRPYRKALYPLVFYLKYVIFVIIVCFVIVAGAFQDTENTFNEVTMKKLYSSLVALLLCSPVLYGSASNSQEQWVAASSSSDQVSEEGLRVRLLFNPMRYLKIDAFFSGAEYEKQDLYKYALEVKKQHYSRMQFLAGVLQKIVPSTATIDDVSGLIKDSPYVSANELPATIACAYEVLKPGTVHDAFRWLCTGALRKRLQHSSGVICRAFFSPLHESTDETKIEETIIWLIRSEEKSIKIASYFFTNQKILTALSEAAKRGVKINIIVDESGSPEALNACGLPYKTWKQQYAKHRLMHHKFILFERNVDGDSFVVSGSYNLTMYANGHQENILVLNNKELFATYHKQFNIVKRSTVRIGPDNGDSSDEDDASNKDDVSQEGDSQEGDSQDGDSQGADISDDNIAVQLTVPDEVLVPYEVPEPEMGPIGTLILSALKLYNQPCDPVLEEDQESSLKRQRSYATG